MNKFERMRRQVERVREFIDLHSGNAPKNPIPKPKKVKGQDVNAQKQKSQIETKSQI